MAAEQGEWENICDLSVYLLPALEAVRAPDPLAGNTPQNPENIRQTLRLLQAAIEKCTERKAQIEPLVNALIPFKDTPDTA